MTSVFGWLMALWILLVVARLALVWRPPLNISSVIRRRFSARVADRPVTCVAPRSMTRAEAAHLGLVWYDPERNVIDRNPAAAVPPGRPPLLVTSADAVYVASMWLARRDPADLPRLGDEVHLPSGRILDGEQVANFVRWLRVHD